LLTGCKHQESSVKLEQPLDSAAFSQLGIEIGAHRWCDFAAVTILNKH